MAWVVKRAKLNFKKVFFWNTLLKMLEQGCLVQGLLVHMVTNRNSAVESGGDSEESVRRRMSLGRD